MARQPEVKRPRTVSGTYAARLSHDLVVETALTLAIREGGAVLTVRNLARELDADPAALYRYFRNKDELILTVADRLLGEIGKAIPDGLSWQDKLMTFGIAVVAVLGKYPAVGALIGCRTTRRTHEVAMVEDILGTMRAAGLNEYDAALCYHTFVDFVFAYAGTRAQWALLDADFRQADEDAWKKTYGALPSENFPNIAALAPHLADVSDDTILRTGLQMMLDGIALKAARATTTSVPD